MSSTASIRRRAAFTTIELVVAMLLFSGATAGVLVMSQAMRSHRTAAASATQENAYATFQSQVALQGLNPAQVGNPLQGAIIEGGTTGATVGLGAGTTLSVVRHRVAQFEVNAVSQPAGAQRNLAGSARVDGINYNVAPSGSQATRGIGVGFAIETTGGTASPSAMPLAPPTFNVQGDITAAPFPLNNIATLPSSNPPGTTYRYTIDGSMPTAGSPLWDNNPGWTSTSFPAQVTLAAFNTDPQYSASLAVTASYSMQLSATYGRADGRTTAPYGFSLGDLTDPTDTGIVLTANVPGAAVVYTIDGSDPTVAGTAYSGPFAPDSSVFTPNVSLRVAVISTDPRYLSAPVTGYTLTSETSPLQPPTFITSNATPLAPGTPVVLSAGSNSSPRTEVNNGNPNTNSSNATSFPLN